MKVYITKYAFTDGIQERVGHLTDDWEYVSSPRGLHGPDHFFCRMGLDAFATREQAEARVRDMCERKLKSLERSRQKVLRVLEAHGGYIR